MVDAAGAILPKGDDGGVLSPAIFVGREASRVYASVCDGICPAPAQHPIWISAWINHSAAETFVAALLDHKGQPVFALPLEIIPMNGVRAASFMSGTHANGNFPAISSNAPEIGIDALDALAAEIGRLTPAVDLLVLERLAKQSHECTNPLLAYPHQESPNPALAVTLEGGFDAVLSRSNGRRKRKKHRSQTRKFEAMGGWKRFRAETPDQTRVLLDAFFDMKSERFRQLGIQNTFADENVRKFFHDLFGEAVLNPAPPFVLHGLEVAGKLRAVTGSSICSSRIVCEFSSFSDDDASHASPGDFLFFENIHQACSDGLEVYDFSVGDEGYKRLWCDRVETQFDCLIPLNAKGRLATMALRTAAEAKRALKSNDMVWQAAKKIRRTVAGG